MADTALTHRQSLALVTPRRIVEVVALAGALGAALWLRVANLDAYSGSFDEGIRSQQLFLMAAGYRPFRDIFSSQGPLLLDLLFPFYLAFGQTLAAVRSGVVACSMVALLGAWWTARQAGGHIAGLAAVVILALSPSFLEGSRLALAEVPTIAPALLALGSLLAYRRTSDRRFLVLSATCAAFALLVKPMALHVGAPVAVLLLIPAGIQVRQGITGWPWRQALVDGLVYGLVVAVICAIVIVLLGPAQVWDNLGAYRGGASNALGTDTSENLRLTANIMRREQAGLFVLGAPGLVLGLWRRPVVTLALAVWAAAVLGLFAVYGDLADKHIVYLTPSIALLAALGAGLGSTDALAMVTTSARPKRYGRATVFGAAIGIGGMVAYIATMPGVLGADRYMLLEAPRVEWNRRGGDVDLEIAEIIRSETPPDGWVLADNPNAAFAARRRVIPYLVDTSGTRVDAGSLTSALATEHVQRYQPSVIVTSPRRLGKLDAFMRDLPALGYRQEKTYKVGWNVYVREP